MENNILCAGTIICFGNLKDFFKTFQRLKIFESIQFKSFRKVFESFDTSSRIFEKLLEESELII